MIMLIMVIRCNIYKKANHVPDTFLNTSVNLLNSHIIQ